MSGGRATSLAGAAPSSYERARRSAALREVLARLYSCGRGPGSYGRAWRGAALLEVLNDASLWRRRLVGVERCPDYEVLVL